MATHSVEWVNGGVAFDVTSKTPSLAATQSAYLEKAHLLKKHLRDMGDLPPDVVKEIRADVEMACYVAMTNILIHDVLSQVDPSVKALTPAEVQDKLDPDVWIAMATSLGEGASKRKDAKRDPLTSAQR